MEGWGGITATSTNCNNESETEEIVRKEKFQIVRDIAEDEGFAHAFVHYSEWDDIDDPEFHKKRMAFLNALKKLRVYIGMDESEVK